MNEKHTLALIWTQYTLMLYMLIRADWKKTWLFLYQGRLGQDIARRIYEKGGRFWGGYYLTVLFLTRPSNIFLDIVLRMFRRVFEKIISLSLRVWIRIIGSKYIRAYGYESIFGATICLDEGCSFSVIEDGAGTYDSYETVAAFFQIHQNPYLDLKNYMPGGWSPKIDEVLLTGRKDTPKGLEQKAKLFNLQELWNQLDINAKHEICYIFDFNLQKWQVIFNQGRDIIFLTQNFSPSSMDEEKEIEMYHELLSAYDCERIIIKVHPADKKNYEELFPQYLVVRDKFPVELLWLGNFSFKKVIGFNSTALYGLWPDEMVESRTDLLKKYIRPELREKGMG